MLWHSNLHNTSNPPSRNQVKHQQLDCLYTNNRNNKLQHNHSNRTKINPQDHVQVAAVIFMVNRDPMINPPHGLHGDKIVITVKYPTISHQSVHTDPPILPISWLSMFCVTKILIYTPIFLLSMTPKKSLQLYPTTHQIHPQKSSACNS